MDWLKRKRIKQVMQYGWQDAKAIAPIAEKSRLSIWFDIIGCFKNYYLFSNQYKQKEVWKLSDEERDKLLKTLGEKNRYRDDWTVDRYSNKMFLYKYSSLCNDIEPKKYIQRLDAYTKMFNMGRGCTVSFGVMITKQHYSDGKIKIGNNVVLSRDVDIDYSGELIIGNKVALSENVKILTHNHLMDFSGKDQMQKGMIKTPLTIGDYVGVGSRAIILPGVEEIGRGASIAAGAVVKRQVPPYAIVMGNPAKVVGFRMTPEQIVEFEKEHYEEKDRLSLELLEANYQKYFLSRIKEIQQFLI